MLRATPVYRSAGDVQLLPKRGRKPAPGAVHRVATHLDVETTILRQALFGDVQLGHDLQPADQRRVQRAVGLHHLAQRAVDAEAHAGRALVGFDVDVAGAVLRGLRQQRVEHADDGRVVGRGQGAPA